MVRLIPVGERGKTVWVEDAPDCPRGHDGFLRPKWGRCPGCGTAMRYWRCDAGGCDAPDMWD